jgi:hypothetical protein
MSFEDKNMGQQNLTITLLTTNLHVINFDF